MEYPILFDCQQYLGFLKSNYRGLLILLLISTPEMALRKILIESEIFSFLKLKINELLIGTRISING